MIKHHIIYKVEAIYLPSKVKQSKGETQHNKTKTERKEKGKDKTPTNKKAKAVRKKLNMN